MSIRNGIGARLEVGGGYEPMNATRGASQRRCGVEGFYRAPGAALAAVKPECKGQKPPEEWGGGGGGGSEGREEGEGGRLQTLSTSWEGS